MWSKTHVALSSHFDVVSYDVRGAGRSSRDEVVHSPSEDLGALLDAFGIERAALIGLSMGARIAFELAAVQPDRISSATLCSLALPEFVTSDCDGMLPEFIRSLSQGRIDTAAQLYTRMWFDGRREPSSVDATRRAAFAKLVDLTFAQTFVHQKWRTLEEIGGVEHIRTPTLFINGRSDWPDIDDTITALNSMMPNSAAVSIDGAAHTLNLDQPRELLRIVKHFLSTHR
jgi:pimeloyl-ACP methyl ester carboxylesterase